MRISLNEKIKKSFGQDTVMEWSEPVSGGDINEAYHLLPYIHHNMYILFIIEQT